MDAHDYIGDDWSDYTIDSIKEELEELGFNDPVISFSGFWSQGDGASFTCSSIELETFFANHIDLIPFEYKGRKVYNKQELQDESIDLFDTFDIKPPTFFIKEAIDDELISAYINRISNRYAHYNTVEVQLELVDLGIEETRNILDYEITKEEKEELNKFYPVFEEYLSEYVKSKCKEIYNKLEKEYNDLLEEYEKQLEEEEEA